MRNAHRSATPRSTLAAIGMTALFDGANGRVRTMMQVCPAPFSEGGETGGEGLAPGHEVHEPLARRSAFTGEPLFGGAARCLRVSGEALRGVAVGTIFAVQDVPDRFAVSRGESDHDRHPDRRVWVENRTIWVEIAVESRIGVLHVPFVGTNML